VYSQPRHLSKNRGDDPASGTVSITNVDLDAALPETGTQFYDPMTIEWQHRADGGACPSACSASGSTTHQLYLTFATPVESPVFLTSMQLGVATGGAATIQQAFATTWAQFSGRQAKNARGQELKYYGEDFDGSAICNAGDNGARLLAQTNRSGQCSCFAELRLGALGANGIGSSRAVSAVRQQVVPQGSSGADRMVVLSWTYDGAGSYAAPFSWGMDVPLGWPSMPPELPSRKYGEVTNVDGIPGQNMPDGPKEKVFINHVFVKTTGITFTGGPYFDPSYGAAYSGPSAFEDKLKG
jgi:hypothetical protein